jgi:hypothetical protein
MKTQAELKQEYKESKIPMGIYLVRNTKTNEFVLGVSRNVEGTLNRYRFVMKMNGPNDTILNCPKLQEDSRILGLEAFEFQVLDTLQPKNEPAWDPTNDLKMLEQMWLSELKGRGWTPY